MTLQNLPPEQIIAMLNSKGLTLGTFCNRNRFHIDDVVDAINGTKMYPNIARLVAQAIGTTKEMLWPVLYEVSVPHQPITTVFILRVHCE